MSNMLTSILTILVFSHAGSISMAWFNTTEVKSKRSFDLSTSYILLKDVRLSNDIIPEKYTINIRPNIETAEFEGDIKINLACNKDTKKIILHVDADLIIIENMTQLIKQNSETIPILRTDRIPKESKYKISMKETLTKESKLELSMFFRGQIHDKKEGIFQSTFNDGENNTISYLATNLSPNNARKLFPCFDEPGFKVPHVVTVTRTKDVVTLFNTPLLKSLPITHTSEDIVMDYFEPTPPMSSYALGFITTKLFKVNQTCNLTHQPVLNAWTPQEQQNGIERTGSLPAKEWYTILCDIYTNIEDYFNMSIPLKKIDFVLIPDLPLFQPIENWGLLIFKESHLLNNGYLSATQELIGQWIGSWVTPHWWNAAYVNKALTNFLAAEVISKVRGDIEFNGKYPLTILYSLYYEFSKRFPYSRMVGMRHEANSLKVQMLFRMFNFTLGDRTFKLGVRNFLSTHLYQSYDTYELWNAIHLQALSDKTLNPKYNLSVIADSWTNKDRFPVLSVIRNYKDKSTTFQQNVFLRERSQDSSEQRSLLWWIPLIIVTQLNLDFSNTKPYAWMEMTREKTFIDLADSDEFIIVNPEEIGPFLVNYDSHNWYLISKYLQVKEHRELIPPYTRAKLLHDAWNLAYAGLLPFDVAFNVTLFMKYERHHVVWSPYFTVIDQIGRLIESRISQVYPKFEIYVRILLQPLYEEIVGLEDKKHYISELVVLSKRFLCHVGYQPCIAEAKKAFETWIHAPNSYNSNLPQDELLCTVFKWGTLEDWQEGLEHLVNFPNSTNLSKRTLLLKSLVACPRQPEKIKLLLNFIALGNNQSITENDIYLTFNTVTKNSNGYTGLLKFVSDNWELLRKRFEDKPSLWDRLISAATGAFKTQKGYEMVKKLYDERSGQFGTAEHIIKNSLKNIKEEAKWGDEHLPIIDKWLTKFLEDNKV